MEAKRKIQIGQMAMRDKDGNFLPATPIYEDWSPELEEAEKKMLDDAAKLFCGPMREYIEGCKKIGITFPGFEEA